MVLMNNGPQNWEVIQQYDGHAKIRLDGECDAPDRCLCLIAKVFDETTDESVTEWINVEKNDNKWAVEMEVPVGGPYRIEVRWKEENKWLARGLCELMLHHICVGDVFVIAGQSNSIGTGHGEVTEEPQMGVHVFRDCRYWDIATHPLYASRGHHGPFVAFAKRLKKSLNYPIGLIPCAVGGSRLSRWLLEEDGDLYREMISTINNRQIKGILWYQGESDAVYCEADNYYNRFSSFVAKIRKDTKNPNLPIFTVQLHRHTDDFINGELIDEQYDLIREAQRKAAKQIENVYVIPSIDAGRLSDGIHNSKTANMLIGERLARLALFKEYRIGKDVSAPDLEYIKKLGDKKIEIKFAGVEDTLMAYHVTKPERFPVLVEDECGKNNIETFEIIGDKITLELSRAIVGTAFVRCQYGRNPNNYIQDFGKQMAVLCFSNVKVQED